MKTFVKILHYVVMRVSVLLLTLTFLFSGFVKVEDPLGMSFKLNAYFQHWGFHFNNYSLFLTFLAIVLGIVEFMMGVYLFLGIRRKMTTLILTIFMACMLAMSVYVYTCNPVADCGCFGDAVRLTNGQTLIKNIVLFACALFLLKNSRHVKRLISERNQWITSVWAFIYVIILSIYSAHYIPKIDFGAYKTGADILSAYKGNIHGYADEQLANFYVQDTKGNDITAEILEHKGYVFILVIPDELSADDGSNDRINDLYDYCSDHHYMFIGLISQRTESMDNWQDRTGAAYNLYYGDESQLKSMARSNPGLILLKNGVIVGKWSANNLPDLSKETMKSMEKSGQDSNGAWTLFLFFFVPLIVIIIADYLWLSSAYYKKRRLRRERIKRLREEAKNENQ